MHLPFRILFALLFLCAAGLAQLQATLPAYESAEYIPEELESVNDYWDGRGRVIVGKVNKPEGAITCSRAPIEDDGSFCTALYPGRTLIFYANGYAPLVVDKWTKIQPKVFDAGTVSFEKAAPEDLRSLQAKVSLETPTGDTQISYRLRLHNDAYLFDDHGHAGSCTITVTVKTKKLAPGQTFSAEGLSRIPYYLELSAPGYIEQKIDIDPEQSGAIDLGDITLQRAPEFRITYKARTRQDGGPWAGGDDVKTTDLVCTGADEFLFTDTRDGLGNKLSLRMKPKGGDVEASFYYYTNAFYDLGKTSSDALPAWQDIDLGRRSGSPRMDMQSGHLYYFKVEDIHETAIQLLFHLEAID